MAAVMGPVRSSNFLPTIKCSDCSADIEISRIGDHVCAGVSSPTSIFAPLALPFITPNPHLSNQSTFRANNVRPPLTRAPNINTKASLLPVDRLLTTTAVHQPHDRFQNSYSSGRQSPLENSGRNTKLHSNLSSLSDASLSQDCAFPPFPTSRSRSTTPKIPSEITQSFAGQQGRQKTSNDMNSTIMPPFSQSNGDSVLHRTDPTVPGSVTEVQPRGHRKTPSMGSSKDFTYQRIGRSESSHSSRPSTASSNNSRKPSLSSISKGPRSKLVHINTDIPRLPTKPGDPVHSFTTSELDPNRNGDLTHRKSSIEKLRPESRSLTYPLDNPTKEENGTRRPSAPLLHMKRPSVAAAIRPLHEIGSVSTFKPSKSLKRRPKSQVALIISETATVSNRNGTGENQKTDKAPSVSEIYLSSEHPVEPRHHATASSSSSSRASSKSGAGSASSASTAPFSGSPPRQKRQPSDADHNLFVQGFEFVVKPQPRMEEPASPRDTSPTFSNRWARTDPADLPALIESMTLAPPPIRDPAIHSGRSSPITPSNDSFAALPIPIPSNDLIASSDHISPSPFAHLPKVHRTGLSNKGRCKGCDELIVGKSVSSADGRLTGRYHKGCFTCTTCKELFRTADFYIHDNHPYCQRHYHQLNQSLCIACDFGIEGQYIETENKQKFHQECFTCQDCKNMLRDHYFEINGERYCERHAIREPQPQHGRPEHPSKQAGAGTGARQHAERRQTRLLMMAP